MNDTRLKFGSRRRLLATLTTGVTLLMSSAAIHSAHAGLVAHYRLDETSGTMVQDETGAHNGTNIGANVGVPGQLSTAYDFDGTDYVEIPTQISVSSAVTFSFWVQLDSLANSVVISKRIAWSVNNFQIYFRPTDGMMDVLLWGLSPGDHYSAPGFMSAGGGWTHVAVSYDGSNVRIYKNGSLHVTSPATGAFNNSAVPTRLGEDFYGNHLDGRLDDIRIWDHALTDSEVADLYTPAVCTDVDMDGYGSPSSSACAHAGLDCNDLDGSINPGAVEACNGVDDNCDSVVPGDEADLDGDGFMACEGDCNDSDASVNPGAFEIPGNFVDEDCNGDLGACDPCFSWKNHGHYVRCVAHAAEELVSGGIITEDDGDALVSSSAQTDIGKKNFVPDECL